MTALVVVEALAILLLGLLVAGLLRSHAEILRQLHQLGAGRDDEMGIPVSVGLAAPMDLARGAAGGRGGRGAAGGRGAQDLAGQTPAGEAVAVGVTGTAHDTLLAFLSSGCLTCAGFWQALGRPGDLGLPPHTRVVAVTKAPGDESPAAVSGVAPAARTVVMSTRAWLDYEVPGSPYFVHVNGPTGRVLGEGTASTWEQVVGLVGRAAEDRLAHQAPGGGGHQEDDPRGAARIDAELRTAGVGPNDPTLYPTSMPGPGDHR